MPNVPARVPGRPCPLIGGRRPAARGAHRFHARAGPEDAQAADARSSRSGWFQLKGRKSVYVHTGRGSNNATHRYWSRKAYVWNNTGDTAYLLYPNGKRADSCSWTSKGSSKYC